MALTAKQMEDIANKAAADAMAAGLSMTDAEKIAEDIADQAETVAEANQMIADMIAAVKKVEASPAAQTPSKTPASAAKVEPSKVDKEIAELLKADRARKHFTVGISTQINGEFYHAGEIYVWDDAVVSKLGPNAKEVKG